MLHFLLQNGKIIGKLLLKKLKKIKKNIKTNPEEIENGKWKKKQTL